MFSTIDLTIDNGLARLTLTNPDKGNPLDLAFGTDLRNAAIILEGQNDLRAILLTAQGKNFSVGGNLVAFSSVDDLPGFVRQSTADYHVALGKIMKLRAPVISAVQGACAGAGVALAAMADLVIAADNSHYTMAYTGIGFSPDGASTHILPRVIGLRRFQELVYTNRRVKAEEARDIGLVTELVPLDDLASRAEELALQIASGPTGAFGVTKKLLLQTFQTPLESQLEAESRFLSEQCSSDDVKEGINAVLGKRAPVFTGR